MFDVRLLVEASIHLKAVPRAPHFGGHQLIHDRNWVSLFIWPFFFKDYVNIICMSLNIIWLFLRCRNGHVSNMWEMNLKSILFDWRWSKRERGAMFSVPASTDQGNSFCFWWSLTICVTRARKGWNWDDVKTPKTGNARLSLSYGCLGPWCEPYTSD